MARATKIREEPTRGRQRGQLALLVLCGAMFLDSLDVSLIGVALPSIEQDLALTPATLQWLISGYTVAYGGFLLLGGRTADLFGRRRVFLAAMVLFAVASLVGGLVTDGTLIMVTRVLKGIAAAFTAPAALSIITTTFHEGPERNRALGVYAATAASGYSLGLVLSGFLTQIHWRLVFLLPAVIAALVIVLAVRVLRGDELARSRNRGYDPLGAISVTAGLLLLVYGLTEAPESGWGSVSTLGVLAAAAALLVAFVVIESRHPDPGVPLRIFASRTLSTANVLGVIFLAASIGWQFIATLYLQRTLEYSPLQTALAFLPLGIMVFLVAEFATGRLMSWIGIRTVASVGFLFQAVGIGLFVLGGIFTDYFSLLLPAVVLHGIGNGLVFPAVNIAGLSGVADEEQGLASGLITASTQIGAGIGVAVVTGVSTGGTRLVGYQYAFAVAAGISVLGAIVAALGLGRVRRPDNAERSKQV
ncbi:MFS transporter [Actinophytocola sp.]|uniref:MFS transporter n=1 Tax=Actinophytocola sp. TaxID=1872138 RepID=UPI002ED17BED